MREHLTWIATGVWLASTLFIFSPEGAITFLLSGLAAFKLSGII